MDFQAMPFIPASRPLRYDSIDALRGLAMLWMTVFHFCFDLSYFGLWPQNFLSDSFWTLQRNAIVSLFLFCAGLGQAIALQQHQGWLRFRRRWLQIILAALLVTAGSYWMFPRSFIYFGVLHGMAVMLILVRLLAGFGSLLWLLGGICLLLPWGAEWFFQGVGIEIAPWFDHRALNWVGLVSRKPFTEDYVPIFPWFGVMCWGFAAGQWILRTYPTKLACSLSWPGRALALLGRWSLSYYLLHQPLLMGLLSFFIGLRS